MNVQISALTPPERLEAMRAYMLGWRLPMDIRPGRPVQVAARSSERDLGAVCLLSTAGSGATVFRDERLARDDTPPQLVLGVLGSGRSVVTQGDRSAHMRPGDVVAYTSTDPYRISFPPGALRHSLLIPMDRLGLPARRLTEVVARPLGPGDPLARVVSSYVLGLAAAAPGMPAVARDAVEEPTVALVRALLSVEGSAARAETLDLRVQEYLRIHLAERDLTAARIAAVHGISERHLSTVLARCGIALRPWLREQRLAAAAEMLAGASGGRLTVAAVAHRWGFADHAHFTREFRKRYGVTPTQWRSR
jgi:AraC-like DNA-binding protein